MRASPALSHKPFILFSLALDLLFVVYSQLDLRENKIGRWGVKPLADALCVNTSVMQVNLDGYSLPIKQLKGTETVASIDLSHKCLGVASVVVIASLIQGNGSLRRLDVGANNLAQRVKICCTKQWG